MLRERICLGVGTRRLGVVEMRLGRRGFGVVVVVGVWVRMFGKVETVLVFRRFAREIRGLGITGLERMGVEISWDGRTEVVMVGAAGARTTLIGFGRRLLR
jgi:hypothetical protein